MTLGVILKLKIMKKVFQKLFQYSIRIKNYYKKDRRFYDTYFLFFFFQRPLGCGAFGDVYQGLLKNRDNDSVDLAVAVKVNYFAG